MEIAKKRRLIAMSWALKKDILTNSTVMKEYFYSVSQYFIFMFIKKKYAEE